MEKKIYIMFHKPAGCITAKSDEKHRTVMEYFKEFDELNLHPVGRLDKETEGLLLITNDGKFNQYLMRPESHVEKTYFFWALGSLEEEQRRRIEDGIIIHGETEPTKPAKLQIKRVAALADIQSVIVGEKYKKIGRNPRNNQVVSGYLTITEGKKHQVKRMLKAAGCFVVYLKRISIGSLLLDDTLKPGEYRMLTEEELKSLGWDEKNKSNYKKL